VAGQEPDEGVASAADFGQKSPLGLARPVRPLLLGLLHQGLVGEDGLELETTWFTISFNGSARLKANHKYRWRCLIVIALETAVLKPSNQRILVVAQT